MNIYTEIMNTKTKGTCPFSGQKCNEYCELSIDESCTISEIMKIADEILSATYDVLNAIEELKKQKKED